jgi:hypothetical protein
MKVYFHLSTKKYGRLIDVENPIVFPKGFPLPKIGEVFTIRQKTYYCDWVRLDLDTWTATVGGVIERD